MSADHVLVVRLDNVGDVLLSGPAVRAVAAGAGRVTYLASSRGAAAAALLPGVDAVTTFDAPWIDAEPDAVRRADMDALVQRLAAMELDRAVVLTSFHQSPLPFALHARMAGVPWIGAVSVDYPGSLLDVRHQVPEEVHEVERALSLVEACGFRLPGGDHRRLAVRADTLPPPGPPPGVTGLGRFRISVFKQRGTFRMVVRNVPFKVPNFEELNLPAVVGKIAKEERGLVLVTGVAGSGKSSTIAALIDDINKRENKHILTIEDPIEYLRKSRFNRAIEAASEYGLEPAA